MSRGNWWAPTAQKVICGTFDGSQIWPPGMVEAFKWNSSYQILQDFGQYFELKHRKKRIPPWITINHHGHEFSKKKTEGNVARTSSLFVHESKSKMCESTKNPTRKKKGVHSYSRSGKHVLEVTSCYRSLQQKIWRYATSGPPRFPKGVEVIYQKQVGHPTQILVPGDSATFTWHGPKVALLWSWPSARKSSTQGSEGDCDEVKKWHFLSTHFTFLECMFSRMQEYELEESIHSRATTLNKKIFHAKKFSFRSNSFHCGFVLPKKSNLALFFKKFQPNFFSKTNSLQIFGECHHPTPPLPGCKPSPKQGHSWHKATPDVQLHLFGVL